MSMAGARDNSYEEFNREYVVNGSLALKRMEQRSIAVQETYHVDLQTVAQAKPKPKAKINVGNVAVLLLMIFAFVMGYLFLQTTIQQNNIEISKLKSELTTLQKQASEMELAIVLGEDIDSIRNTAVREFGMVSPGEGQIVNLSVSVNKGAAGAQGGG